VDGDTTVEARLDGSVLHLQASGTLTRFDLVVEPAGERPEISEVVVNGHRQPMRPDGRVTVTA
jgi:hypothetical protein